MLKERFPSENLKQVQDSRPWPKGPASRPGGKRVKNILLYIGNEKGLILVNLYKW